MALSKKPATYADLEALPDHVVGEIIDGELHVSPRPRPRHALSASTILADLLPPFHHGSGGGPGGWWILMEPELRLGVQTLVPDIAGWRRARLATLPETAAISVAPDWICEVLSPSTARVDRTRKLRIYAEHGVGHVWLADPLQRIVEVYRASAAGWILVATASDEDRVRLEPFDAIELEPARWWLPRPPGRASEEWAPYEPESDVAPTAAEGPLTAPAT